MQESYKEWRCRSDLNLLIARFDLQVIDMLSKIGRNLAKEKDIFQEINSSKRESYLAGEEFFKSEILHIYINYIYICWSCTARSTLLGEIYILNIHT